MPKHLLSPEAAEDLTDIHDYIAENNLTAARKLTRRFREIFRHLERHNELGRVRPELQDGLRSFPVDNYVVFYRVWGGRVFIVRIIHAARDIDAIFS